MNRSVAQRVVAVVLAATGSVALADFIDPGDYGWSRGDADSTYFEWDVFVSVGGGNDPDVGQFPDPLPGDWISPDVIETSGNGLVTGSGNIYSPFGPINVEVTVPNYGHGQGETTLLLQVRAQGTELDYENVTLGGTAPDEVIELERSQSDMGWLVDTLFVFSVDGNEDQYVFTVPTVEAHCSVDRIAVDTFTAAGACVADFNGDGSVNTQDVIAYLNAWSAKDPRADVNGDGSVNTQDFIAFLNLWVAGC
jgi:hypothetical protein